MYEGKDFGKMLIGATPSSEKQTNATIGNEKR